MFTSWELRDTLIKLVKGNKYKYFIEGNGIPKPKFYRHKNNILNKLNIRNVGQAKSTINTEDERTI